MTAAALIAEAQQHGVRLWVEGGQVRVRAHRAPPPDLLARLRAQRDEVMQFLAPAAGAGEARDAWGLSETDRAEAKARLFPASASIPAETAPADPAPMDHDAGERAAMVAHYAGGGAAPTYRPDRPDELRDGLVHGFHAHRAAWESLIYGAERGAAFAEARGQPGACSTCAGHRWWRGTAEPDAALRCATCHPPIHLPLEAVHEVTT